jgi:hypothetical protein
MELPLQAAVDIPNPERASGQPTKPPGRYSATLADKL